jgi:hypothetical protein
MKIIKLFSWEDSFYKRIRDHRNAELQNVFKFTIFAAIFYGFTYVVPSIVAIITFSIYAAFGNPLSPEIVWPALALIGLLRVPMVMMPETVATAIQGNVVLNRISRYLSSPELASFVNYEEGDGDNAVEIKVWMITYSG